ncbi:flippase [Pseudalkalibacillus salsuginis]|uniref:flippase n=1 Tax=Pseudalkalibacillus salsuginis TaxID=2910972 RepID=UPI001F3F92E0|nr:flippase [Pseudalkalibacillus salsuginis]MCF6410126.1 flippase [Pseudalkalibacillus salsuginis]
MRARNSFAKDSFITITRQFTSILLGMLLLIVLARFLGPSGQGQYTLVILLPQLLMTFMNLGVNTSTIYYVSREEIDVDSAVKNNLYIGVFLSFVSILIGMVIAFFFSDRFFEEASTTFLLLSLIALPFMFLNIYFQTVFQGLQQFGVFNTILIITQLGTLFFVCLFIIVLDYGLTGAVVAFILGHLITTVSIVYILYAKFGFRYEKGAFNLSYFKKSVLFGLKAHISNVMSFLNYRIDLLLLGYFLNPAAVGVYVTAVNIGERISILSQSLSTVLLPRIASVDDERDRNRVTSILTRNFLVFVLLLTIGVFFFADWVIDLLFGVRYEKSSSLLKWLIPGVAALSIDRLLSNDIAGRGKPEVNMYVSLFNVLFNVGLNIYLIPLYGVVGAAVATTTTYILSLIIKIYLYKKVTSSNYRSFLLIQRDDLYLYSNLFKQLKTKMADR